MFHIIAQDNDRVVFPAHDEVLETIKFFNLTMTGSVAEISRFLMGTRKDSSSTDQRREETTTRLPGNDRTVSDDFYVAENFPKLSRRRSSSIASWSSPIPACEIDVNVTNTLQQNALHIACSRMYKPNTLILDDNASSHPVFPRLQSEDALNLVKILLQYGVSINAKDCMGRTPLMYASYYGAADIISFLIPKLLAQRQKYYGSLNSGRQYSDVNSQENIVNEIISTQDYRGCTALHYVVRSQSLNALNAMRLSLAKIHFHSSHVRNRTSTPVSTITKAFSALKAAQPVRPTSDSAQQKLRHEEEKFDGSLADTITLLEDDDYNDDFVDDDGEFNIEFSNISAENQQPSLSSNQLSLFKRGSQATAFMSSFIMSPSILEIENKDGNTALHEALLYPESGLTRELLLAGAKPPFPNPCLDAMSPHVSKHSVVKPIDAPLIATPSLPKVIMKKLKSTSICS